MIDCCTCSTCVDSMAALTPRDSKAKVLNFNVGVLGHIDSGKTALAKALSTVASTASFDKNPQSKERGITLDLGFSSFSIPIPSHLSGADSSSTRYESVQFTLVDCPGHASLIRTIIGGAQIIDLMMLVVDITKGIQTQTAECLVIGEITCGHMIVVLNKTDLIEETKREAQITKMTKKMSRTLESTRFAGAPIVAVAAKPGGPDAPDTENAPGVDKLIEVLSQQLFVPERNSDGPFIFSVDHCFPIRGQGTVMTGTVLTGCVAVNDTVEIPFLKVTKKVKSMQMFRQPVQRARQGDRVGICVTQFDPKQVERCLVCSPGHLPTLFGGIIRVFKIPYHKSQCLTGAKFHVTVGHETVMAKATFFSWQEVRAMVSTGFDFSQEFPYQEHLNDSGPIYTHSTIRHAVAKPDTADNDDDVISKSTNQFALLEFEKPITCHAHSIVIGSRLDSDAFANTCRIAFHGKLVHPIVEKDYETTILPNIKIFKTKSREGFVDRMQDEHTVVGKGLFKKETNIEVFTGLRVELSTGEVGIIEGTFGTSGKFRVTFRDGLKPDTIQMLASTGKKKGKAKQQQQQETSSGAASIGGGDSERSVMASSASAGIVEQSSGAVKISLNFKRYVFDPNKRMIQ